MGRPVAMVAKGREPAVAATAICIPVGQPENMRASAGTYIDADDCRTQSERIGVLGQACGESGD